MRRRERRLKPLIGLFVAGTAPLVDAAAELGDTSTRDFDTGDTACAFLRSRGLIAPDVAGLEGLASFASVRNISSRGAFAWAPCSISSPPSSTSLDVLYDLYGEPAANHGRRCTLQVNGTSAETTRAT